MEDTSPLIKHRKVDLSENVCIEWYTDGRYKHVCLDGMVIALCPTLETAHTVARALKQAYSI